MTADPPSSPAGVPGSVETTTSTSTETLALDTSGSSRKVKVLTTVVTTVTKTIVDDDGADEEQLLKASEDSLNHFVETELFAPESPFHLVSEKGDLYANLSQNEITGNVFHVVAKVFKKTAQQNAFVFEDPRKKPVTFSELAAKVDAIANNLYRIFKDRPLTPAQYSTANRGAKAADYTPPKVLILMPVSVELFATAIACYKVGAVLVLLDPQMEVPKMRKCIQRANVDAIVTSFSSTRYKVLEHLFPQLASVKHVCRINESVGSQPLFEDVPIADIPGSQPAIMTFTTGSTGTPKPILKSHNFIKAQLYTLTDAMQF
ncbi:hypothetical protein HK102_009396, partial [Quaeritorhiza haematococci]